MAPRCLGRSDAESDLDVAAIVRDSTPNWKRLCWRLPTRSTGTVILLPLISLKVIDSRSFAACLEKGFSFYRKVAQEGIAL